MPMNNPLAALSADIFNTITKKVAKISINP
jgi:hypothetical protein